MGSPRAPPHAAVLLTEPLVGTGGNGDEEAGRGRAKASSRGGRMRVAPVDRWRLAYIIFYIQGVGQLFPWNAFITAQPYFSQRFCGTRHAKDFENYFSLTFMFSNLVFQALLVKYAAAAGRFSVTARITSALFLLLVIFAVTTVLALFKDVARDPLFAFTNLCVALCGACTSMLQAAIFGYAAVFPPRYTQAMMAGQGLAGLVTAAAAIATAASSDVNPCDSLTRATQSDADSPDDAICTGYDRVDYNSIAYFGACVFIIIVCMVSFLFLETLPFTQFYTRKLSRPPQATPRSSSEHGGSTITSTLTCADGVPPPPTAAAATAAQRDRVVLLDVVGSNGGDGVTSSATSSVDDRGALAHQGSASFLLEDEEAEEEAEREGGRRVVLMLANSTSVSGDGDDGGREGDAEGDAAAAAGVRDGNGSGAVAPGSLGGCYDGAVPLPEEQEAARQVIAAATPITPKAAAAHRRPYHDAHRLESQPQPQPQAGSDARSPSPSLPPPPPVSFWRLLRYLGSPGAAVFLVFFMTLAIFPSTTVHIVSESRCQGKGAFYDKAFVPFQFLLFNLFDFIGRTLAGSACVVRVDRLWLWSLARVVFFPLFLYCNVEGSVLRPVFASDWWPTLFMLAFATSNGYLSSLAMMLGPGQAPVPLAETAGITMVLLMTMGLSGGSLFSFLVTAVSEGRI